jgi:hypothetical protein
MVHCALVASSTTAILTDGSSLIIFISCHSKISQPTSDQTHSCRKQNERQNFARLYVSIRLSVQKVVGRKPLPSVPVTSSLRLLYRVTRADTSPVQQNNKPKKPKKPTAYLREVSSQQLLIQRTVTSPTLKWLKTGAK